MYGVTNLTFLFNVAQANRVVRTSVPVGAGAGAGEITSISLNPAGGFNANSTNLYLTYLTPHPSDLLPSKNVVGYYDLPRYISSGQSTIGPATVDANGVITPSAPVTLTSQSLQLNQIPSSGYKSRLVMVC